MKIPLLGFLTEDNKQVLGTYVADSREEAQEAMRKWVNFAGLCRQVYLFGDTVEPGEDEVATNPIQNTILSQHNVQVKDGFPVTIEPIETGEPAEWYWDGPQDVGIGLRLEPFQIAEWVDDTEQVQAPMPMDPDIAEQLLASAMPKGAAMPGQIREDWIVGVDDRLVADELQAFFDVHWDRVDATDTCEEWILDKTIDGWSYLLYQFDDENHRHDLRLLPLSHVFVDPTARDIDKAAYAGFFDYMDADEAKRKYPNLTAYIDQEAKEGRPGAIDGSHRVSGAYDHNFRHKRIPLYVTWLRNQPKLLTEEEAVESGAVEQREIFNDAIQSAGTPPNENGGGYPDAEQESPVARWRDPATGGEVIPLAEDAALAVPSPVRYFIPGTDTEVTPTIPDPESPGEQIPHPDWPKRLVVRQVTQIGDEVVDDRESEFGGDGIPLILNTNIASGSGPFGLGEAYRLYRSQRGLNRSLTSMLRHGRMYSNPPSVESQSMHNSLPEEYREGFTEPGMRYVVPDDVYREAKGQVQTFQNVPSLSPADTYLSQYLSNLVDKDGGNGDIMQGRASSNVKSGDMVGRLQSAATSIIDTKNRRTGRGIKRLAQFMIHSLMYRETVDDFLKVCSLPRHIGAAVWDRRRFIEWNIRAKIDGGGGMQMQKRQLAQADLQSGGIGIQTYRERVGINHRVEKRRQREEAMEQARQAALLQPAMPAEQPPQ